MATAQKEFFTRLKQYAQGRKTFATRFNQFDAPQMLWDDVHVQYARLRASTTNAQIIQLSMAFFPPAVVLNEKTVPGQLNVLLTGETISQLHTLRSIKEVTDFIAVHP